MKIVQLIDTLDAGGAERVAVNYANKLSDEFDVSYLTTTRSSGVLQSQLNNSVQYFNLQKTSTFDFGAIKKFKRYLKEHDINIIHAHTTSYFFAVLTKLLYSNIKVIWHDHQGNRDEIHVLKQLPLILSSFFLNGIITVNERLESWAKKNLYTKNVLYVENFVTNESSVEGKTILFGKDGKRIISLANLRNPKNHLLLLNAFKEVQNEFPEWTLHLVGRDLQDEYSHNLFQFIKTNTLENSIFIYGSRNDISHILKQCQIGVITSTYEGLPMALLEYGAAGLSVITTDVGNCKKLIEGRGIVVESDNKDELTKALSSLMNNETQRKEYAKLIKDYIDNNFTDKTIIKKVLTFYKKTLK